MWNLKNKGKKQIKQSVKRLIDTENKCVFISWGWGSKVLGETDEGN